MAEAAITTYGLSKRYQKARHFALRDLELNIKPGEIYGFLGPNGAGKTTTIRLLMNFIVPTRGQARILGLDTLTQSVQVKDKVGYLAGEVELYPKMNGRQLLAYLSDLRPPPISGYVNVLCRRFKVELNQRISSLSRGNRQKLGIVQAFMNHPEVLILDEPTAGLDPLMQEEFFDLVRETKERGATIFLSSHNLTEVQKVCDRVGIIRAGRLIKEQDIGDIVASSVQVFNIAFAKPVPEAQLRTIAGLKLILNSQHHATIKVRGDLRPLFRVLAKHQVRALDRQESDLEEEFLKFYRGQS
ncbi:TPA: ABC transporter [Candidatus Saccharibacteria bacterium]|nr:MAG: hypothetical protein A3F05_03885 [Candidatus Saccharibacteria bacterium RIFCSPHIGHO2_12_FULL_47_17]HCM52183.1 ABC transporter [Candidatus Saccharibacteria bacterium]